MSSFQHFEATFGETSTVEEKQTCVPLVLAQAAYESPDLVERAA